MSLPTPSQSVSHKWFHQCVNHKKKLSLRHPLPTFGSFSFFQASLWLGVDKVLPKPTKSYKSELRHIFQCCILIPRKCLRKTPFQHTVPTPQIFKPSDGWHMYLLLIFDHETPQSFFSFKPAWLDFIFYCKVNFRSGIKYAVDFLMCWYVGC